MDKYSALEAINLIKKKRSGAIKGRTCANGSRHRRFLKPGETVALPTVSLEALLGDVHEDRDVCIFDVPGAYLQASMPERKKLLMNFRGQFVDIMCSVNKENRKHMICEKGQKVLYVRVLKAVYGCIEYALLWYNLYTGTLKDMGFVINPYDRCVANKDINGKQCTVTWYVDDNKLSHADTDVVTEILDEISEHFGELVVSRGDKHDLLGMHIEIDRKNRKIWIDIIDQLEEALEMFGEVVDNNVVTPAYKDLMTIDIESPQLSDAKRERFHSVVAKLLFNVKRSRPDIKTTISFLMRRVAKSTEQYWEQIVAMYGIYQKDNKR